MTESLSDLEFDAMPIKDLDKMTTAQGEKNVSKAYVQLFVVPVAALLYGIHGIVGRLSRKGLDIAPYSVATVIFIAELTKLIVSLGCLSRLNGFGKAIRMVTEVPVRNHFHFAIPAFIYMITNNLDIHMLRYMDPGTQFVLAQLKIVSTALLWRAFFKKPISTAKWTGIAFLVAGSAMCGWPKDEKKEKEMYIEKMGLILISVQIILSACAGIYNEWVFKNIESNQSIHLQNISMYTWGIILNFAKQQMFREGQGTLRTGMEEDEGFFAGWSIFTIALVCTYAFKGLLMAQLMKYANNIVKLFVYGIALLITNFLTWLVFGLVATTMFLIGLTLVVIGVTVGR